MLSFVAAVAEASTVKSSAEVIVKSFPALKDPATLTVLELSASATIAAIEGTFWVDSVLNRSKRLVEVPASSLVSATAVSYTHLTLPTT